MTVSELISEAENQWNASFIKEIFVEDDWKQILSIPLGSSGNEDKLIWHYNKNGRFSVRSAYHLAFRIVEMNKPTSSSSSRDESKGWTWIWNMKLPTKIKVFAWRACKNLLPTRTELCRRKIAIEMKCALCGEIDEDLSHCLSLCSFSRLVWVVSHKPLKVHRWTNTSVKDWFLNMRKETDAEQFRVYMLVCWALWHFRNKNIFEGQVLKAKNVAVFARNYGDMLNHHSMAVLSAHDTCAMRDQWKPPNPGVVKINFDAAVNCADGIVGIGVIARTHSEECVGWSSHCIEQYLDPDSAEAKAAYFAVDFARNNGWRRIIIEGDSSVVVAAITRASEDMSTFGNIVADTLAAGSYFDHFSACHIRRTGNLAAHEVARLSAKGPHSITTLPSSIQKIEIDEADL